MYSILQTAKLNAVNPEAYLTDTLAKIAAGHPISRISELMPWVYRSSTHERPDRMLQPHAREAGFFGAQHGRGR